MKVFSNTFDDKRRLPGRVAHRPAGRAGHHAPPANRNPHVAWSDVPEGTRSLVLVAVDVGIPAGSDEPHRSGRAVPADLPPQEFHPWVLVDIDPRIGEIAEGALGEGDHRGFFAGDPAQAGGRSGTDGPCPPGDDGLVHRCVFLLYATDLESFPLAGTFSAADVLEAIDHHVLGEASFTGHYALDPAPA
ncbi:YbhB/YbcL family Raf kinase inhibitor-like protein [Streptomyces polychromogenes]|nr:YbhB/YbcL family Raf kinase inhibitor-like protein [Streptomyces polychromogenes]